MQLQHKINPTNKDKIFEFTVTMMINTNNNFLKLIFTDEVTFYVWGTANREIVEFGVHSHLMSS